MIYSYKSVDYELPLSDEVRAKLLNRGKDPFVRELDRRWANLGQAEQEADLDEQEAAASEGDYSDLTKKELLEEVESRNTEIQEQGYDEEPLSTGGSKNDLIARLEEFDQRHPADPAE